MSIKNTNGKNCCKIPKIFEFLILTSIRPFINHILIEKPRPIGYHLQSFN